MKRVLVLLLAAGGAAWWWTRRSESAPSGNWNAPAPGATPPPPSVVEPPRLGGDVAPELLEILACPVDKAPVTREGNYLVCSSCQRHYPIRDGIPVMLVDEALTPEAAAQAR